MSTFKPSRQSYGEDDLLTAPPAQPSGGGGGGGGGAAQAVDIGLTVAKSLFGLDANERESAAEIQAQLTIARQKSSSSAFPGAWYWKDRATKLQARLGAAQALAAEEQRGATIDQLRNVGYTLAAFAGVAVLGSVAYVQIQRGRLVQAEAHRLRGY